MSFNPDPNKHAQEVIFSRKLKKPNHPSLNKIKLDQNGWLIYFDRISIYTFLFIFTHLSYIATSFLYMP